MSASLVRRIEALEATAGSQMEIGLDELMGMTAEEVKALPQHAHIRGFSDQDCREILEFAEVNSKKFEQARVPNA